MELFVKWRQVVPREYWNCTCPEPSEGVKARHKDKKKENAKKRRDKKKKQEGISIGTTTKKSAPPKKGKPTSAAAKRKATGAAPPKKKNIVPSAEPRYHNGQEPLEKFTMEEWRQKHEQDKLARYEAASRKKFEEQEDRIRRLKAGMMSGGI